MKIVTMSPGPTCSTFHESKQLRPKQRHKQEMTSSVTGSNTVTQSSISSTAVTNL